MRFTPAAVVATLGISLTLVAFAQSSERVAIRGLNPEEVEILSHLSIVYLDDGQGGLAKTIRVTGVNVQIVNGLGATNGNPQDPMSTDPLVTKTNGLGNLTLGYNELGNFLGDDRTGSHNIVAGTNNTYTSFGGLVVAQDNLLTGPYASISGGAFNEASAARSSVSGGWSNLASGDGASISGGRSNTASGIRASVSGGMDNVASGKRASISGGRVNLASTNQASIGGGTQNTASGFNSVVCGGSLNIAAGFEASVLGGYRNDASEFRNSISGGLFNTATGNASVVCGGAGNIASGDFSTVGGGEGRAAGNSNNWVAGGLQQEN